MGKKDLAVNRLLERKEIFSDLMNGIIFDGQQILNPAHMELISQKSGVLQRRDDGKITALERTGDIRMKADMGIYSVIFCNETQGKVDYTMPVRNMLYDALEYTKQIQELEKAHKMEGDITDTESFLSGITKEDRLQPVITTVLFLGEEWDGAVRLRDLLEINEQDKDWRMLSAYLPEYHINVINAGSIEDPSKFTTSLQQIFYMLRYRKDKKLLKQYLDTHRKSIERMDQVEKMAAFVMLGEQKRIDRWLSSRTEKGEWDMCQAIEDMIKDGERQGEIIGEARGEARGEAKMAALMKQLLKDNRIDLIAQVADDAALRQNMYQQYGI